MGRRRLLEWVNDRLLGGAREREAREQALRDLEKKRNEWDALSPDEQKARLSRAGAERLAMQAAREREALKTFPFELVTVPGDEPLATFERLRGEGRGAAVILGELSPLRDQIAAGRPPRQIIARAVRLIHPAGLVKKRMAARAQDLARMASGGVAQEDFLPAGDVPPDDSPAKPQRADYKVRTSAGAPAEQCYIALLPTQDWTEAPAYLAFGGYNACPPPEDHIAAMRSWRDRYGAELVTMSADTLEFRVARPPSTGAEAMALAEEHYAYCGGDAESIGQMATDLQNSEWWFFWWD